MHAPFNSSFYLNFGQNLSYMAEVILMPRLSDTMTEGVIAAWHKKVGDTVKKGDLLAEVETDKATMDLESYKDGTLLYTGTDKGGKVQVNELLAIIGSPGEDITSLVKGGGAQAPAAAAASPAPSPAPAASAPAANAAPAVQPAPQPAASSGPSPDLSKIVYAKLSGKADLYLLKQGGD